MCWGVIVEWGCTASKGIVAMRSIVGCSNRGVCVWIVHGQRTKQGGGDLFLLHSCCSRSDGGYFGSRLASCNAGGQGGCTDQQGSIHQRSLLQWGVWDYRGDILHDLQHGQLSGRHRHWPVLEVPLIVVVAVVSERRGGWDDAPHRIKRNHDIDTLMKIPFLRYVDSGSWYD